MSSLLLNQFCYLTKFNKALKNLLSSDYWGRSKSHSKGLVSNKQFESLRRLEGGPKTLNALCGFSLG